MQYWYALFMKMMTNETIYTAPIQTTKALSFSYIRYISYTLCIRYITPHNNFIHSNISHSKKCHQIADESRFKKNIKDESSINTLSIPMPIYKLYNGGHNASSIKSFTVGAITYFSCIRAPRYKA